MELIIEIPNEEAAQMGLQPNQKLTITEFLKLMNKEKMKKALEKSYNDAVKHGYADLSMDEISNIVAGAKEEYKKHEKADS